MENWDFILGVDVSKKTLDVYCRATSGHIQIGNSKEGFRVLQNWCKDAGINLARCLIAMEYTGGYEYKLMQFCQAKQIDYCRIPGLAIKNSMGIVRGKCDKVDSRRIAQYATEKRESLKSQNPINPTIIRLRQLLSFRKRLVREAAGYKTTLGERNEMYGVKSSDLLVKIIRRKINANNCLVKKIEGEMLTLIQTDQQILRNYHIIRSIRGIGVINALMTIAYTENFSCFTNPRSYAVYVGVVPFDHSSGTSIRGRKRVSSLANKELKQELNQAAKTAIAWNKDIKQYAENKSKSKPYKVVLNNVKFKLILRMFSLVKRGAFYTEQYKPAA